MSGFARTAEPGGPVGVTGLGKVEFVTPAIKVKADLGFAFVAGKRVDRLVLGVSDGAGVGVKVGFAAESGSDGVLFDVEERGAVLAWGCNVLGVKVITPEVAFGAAEPVDEAGVLALEVLHEAGDGAFTQGLKHEMHVVGHDAEGVDADFVAAGEEIEAVEVEDDLGLGVEDALALGSALVDVVDLTAFETAQAGRELEARFAGHLC